MPPPRRGKGKGKGKFGKDKKDKGQRALFRRRKFCRFTAEKVEWIDYKDVETLKELEHSFKFSDAVLRHLIVSMPKAHTAPSPMMREEKSKSMMGERGMEGRPGETTEPGRIERPAA